MKISGPQEQNIKTFYPIFFIFILTSLWIGCSSSGEAVDDEYLIESMEEDTSAVVTPVVQIQAPEPDNKTVQSNQLFSVKSDTLDIQPKRKQKKTAPSSISVKSSPPKKFYTVDVGAFRLQSNVLRHQEQLAKRFKVPIIVFVDTTIHLTRVCIGNFSSKKSAIDFLTMMKTKYPKDYPDLWVSQLTK